VTIGRGKAKKKFREKLRVRGRGGKTEPKAVQRLEGEGTQSEKQKKGRG